MKRRSVVSFCVAVVSSTAVPVWPEVRPVIRSQVDNQASRVALERALPGAARKLAEPGFDVGKLAQPTSEGTYHKPMPPETIALVKAKLERGEYESA